MTKTIKHLARKRFGQNFLRDDRVIERIVGAINPRKDQHVVEIGPGLGALTAPLLEHAGHLTAVELDRDLIPVLSTRFVNAQNFSILQADALKFDFYSLTDRHLPFAEKQSGQQTQAGTGRLRLVGNLPYNISTPLMLHLLQSPGAIADMHFMLQKEVVDRIAARPGSRQYGRLSIMAQYRCQVESVIAVGPEAFQPPPKVWSAVVRMVPFDELPYPCTNDALLNKVVSQAFSMRRKTLRNALRTQVSAEQLVGLGLDPQARPETLSLADYVRLTDFIDSLRFC